MKKVFLLFFVVNCLNALAQNTTTTPAVTNTLVANPNRKVQIAILLDNSGSMQGLLQQAKSTIWQVVNAASKLSIDNEIPVLQIALYEYGNGTMKHTGFITDLDSISGLLFGLPVRGGDEYCGTVIQDADKNLVWTSDPKDLHLVYIAGNEPFNQGPDNFRTVIPAASKKNIIVNTIFCGPYDEGVKTFWYEGAQLSQGNYFNINSNDAAFSIETPYDDTLIQYNDSINKTYMGYGASGNYRLEKQASEDSKNRSHSKFQMSERAVSKADDNYDNSSWDLIDKSKDRNFSLDSLKKEDLPKELQDKTKEEIKVIVEKKAAERTIYQQKINETNQKREAFIQEEKKKIAEGAGKEDLGTSIIKSMNSTAVKQGYVIQQ